MNTEYEVKFVRVDINHVRDMLTTLGAELHQPMRLMRRAIIDTPALEAKNAFIRVRDEGDKVTMTCKQFSDLSVDGAHEYEVAVSDFQTTLDILAMADLSYKSLQESKRETWLLDGAEVVIDMWPWLDPYIEIEGRDEQHVRQVAEQMGYHWDTAVFGDVMAAYRVQYPHLDSSDTVGSIETVRFDDPLPKLLQSK